MAGPISKSHIVAFVGAILALGLVWALMQFSPVGAGWRETQYKQRMAAIQWPQNPPELDALMGKYKGRTITPEESAKLKELCLATASKIEAIVYELSNAMPPAGQEASHHQMVHEWSIRAQKLRGTANQL